MTAADLAWLADVARVPASRAPATQGVPETTMEIARLAVPKRRRKWAIAIGGTLAALAAVAALFRASIGPLPLLRTVLPSRTESAPSAAPLDASGLALRPEAPQAEPIARAAAPVASPAAPARLIGGGRHRARIRELTIAAKDRKLLDLLSRKQDVAKVAVADAGPLDTAKGTLDDTALAKTLGSAQGAFSSCVNRALRTNPGLSLRGRRTLVLTIQPSGVVSQASMEDEALERSDLGRCLVASARRLIFPAFEGEAFDLAVPLALSAVR